MDLWRFRNTLNRAVLDKLPSLQWISTREGMGSPWTQHVLNVACWCLRGTGEAYMEVGSWHGQSLEAASRNCDDIRKISVEVDVKDDLVDLTKRLPNTSLIAGNIFQVDLTGVCFDNPVGVYFYDGDHTFTATELSLGIIEPHLANNAIIIMDDLCYPQVFAGWREGCSRKGFQIVNEFWPTFSLDPQTWWNGFGIAEYTRIR